MMPIADFFWPPLLYAYSYTVWWAILGGLLIEGIVYFFAWHRGFWRTVALTLGVNLASALAGVAFSLSTQVFLDMAPKVLIAVVWSFVPLVFALTVAIEYYAGVFLFRLPRTRRTLGFFIAANVPSVGLALFAGLYLISKH
jgi:hypothetical protein